MATSSTTSGTSDLSVSRSIYEHIKRPDEVLKLTMDDMEKFTLIVNLVEVGRVSNREVVNSVLYLVSYCLL